MINVKPYVLKALETVCENVVDGFPSDWEKYPIISFKEEGNTPHTITDGQEQISTIRYKVDVWTFNESASNLAIDVAEALFNLGLVRTFGADAPEQRQGLKHKVLRFEGDIDVNTLHVYHN